MAGGEITLSPHAAMFLSERLDLVPHPMLRVGRLPVSATEDDKLAATDEGRNHLRSIGLMDHNDLEPVVEDAWYALSRPPLAVGLATHSRRGPSYNAVFIDKDAPSCAPGKSTPTTPKASRTSCSAATIASDCPATSPR